MSRFPAARPTPRSLRRVLPASLRRARRHSLCKPRGVPCERHKAERDTLCANSACNVGPKNMHSSSGCAVTTSTCFHGSTATGAPSRSIPQKRDSTKRPTTTSTAPRRSARRTAHRRRSMVEVRIPPCGTAGTATARGAWTASACRRRAPRTRRWPWPASRPCWHSPTCARPPPCRCWR